jgi:hypothetical protein
VRKVLKITRGRLMFIVPFYWLDTWGFIKPAGICALKVFFGDKTNEEADEELEIRDKRIRRGWYL